MGFFCVVEFFVEFFALFEVPFDFSLFLVDFLLKFFGIFFHLINGFFKESALFFLLSQFPGIFSDSLFLIGLGTYVMIFPFRRSVTFHTTTAELEHFVNLCLHCRFSFFAGFIIAGSNVVFALDQNVVTVFSRSLNS